jgi:hypothetical protein
MPGAPRLETACCFEPFVLVLTYAPLLFWSMLPLQIRSSENNLGSVEHVRFILYEAATVVGFLGNLHAVIFFTAAARRKRRSKNVAKPQAAVISGYQNRTSVPSQA